MTDPLKRLPELAQLQRALTEAERRVEALRVLTQARAAFDGVDLPTAGSAAKKDGRGHGH